MHRHLSTAAATTAVLLLVGAAVGVGAPAQADEAVLDGPSLRVVVVAQDAGQAGAVAQELEDLAGQGLVVVDQVPAGRTLTVEVPASTVADLVPRIERTGGVAEVVPETTYELFDTPDDPQVGGDQGASLRAVKLLPQAWDVTHGSSSVVVAIVDTGVAAGHPDLAGKVVGSYDATTEASTAVDTVGHGTMVASIAAAATDNGIGMAGSGWDTSVLAVKVADPDGVITNAAVADGIDWAVAHGADVINISLGSPTDDAPVRQAVERAVDADVVVVAAAGNGSASTKFFPAALPDVLAVGATTGSGSGRASFSQFGTWVDLGAPGVGMVGANLDWATEADYVVGDGTSFASPLVAGTVGLVRASRPELDQAAVRNALTSTASSKDFGFAHGLMDAYAALGVGLVLPGPNVVSPLPGAALSEQAVVQVIVPAGVVADRVRIQLSGSGVATTLPISSGQASGTLDLSGSFGPETLQVLLCRQTLCSLTGTDVPVTVTNPAPSISEPVNGARVLTGFVARAASPGRAVRFLADGSTVLGTVSGASPFQLAVAISALSPGAHVLTAVECDAAGTLCATDHPSAPVSIVVARLSPTITSLGPSPFSPNDDGLRDVTVLTFDVDVASDVTVRILAAGGAATSTAHLGTLAPGPHSWTWLGKGTAGSAVPSGTYTAVVDTAATVDGEALIGQATRNVVVDTVAPKIASATSTVPTVYPVLDGYRDSTILSLQVGETTRSVTATVYDAAGRAVWSGVTAYRPAGRVGVTFSGRTASGAMLAPGTYSYLIRVVDPALNVSVSGRHPITVSGKRLSAPRTATRTITAEQSFEVWFNDDDCSGLYLSSWAPGALRWKACPSGSVLSWHHLTLPAAAAYGNVRVGAYGLGSTGATAYVRYLQEDDSYLGGTYFHETLTTHWASAVPITSRLLKGQQVRWSMLVGDGDAYTIQNFTVRWTYYVLE